MKISSIMVRNVRAVKPSDTARRAVAVMNRYRIGSVLVINGNKISGIITERDILKRVVAMDKKATAIFCRNIMSRRIKTVDAESSVTDAVNIMAKYGIKKLPVMEDGKLAGIVTATDLLKSGEQLEYAALKKLAEFFPVGRQQAVAG